jgi:HEPN domain-containing protein
MVDIQKQITYWKKGAKEDWKVAQELIERKWARQGLFFAHLALEKALKAHVCKNTRTLAPKVHNLGRLSELAGIQLTEKQKDLLGDMNEFQLEGRYPEFQSPVPTLKEARQYLPWVKEVLEWLIKQL